MAILVFLTGTLFGEEAVVQTKSSPVREYNRFYAPVLITVYFEDRLTVLEEKGDWVKVKAYGVEGWIPASAIQKQEEELRPVLLGTEMTPEEDNEVTLAGKGFNPQVEKRLQEMDEELDFSKVDEIESYTPDEKLLRIFIQTGGLNFPE